MGFNDTQEMIEYEAAVVPRIIQDYTGFDETEYFNNLAGNYEYDTTRESEGTRGGSELLQGEQAADNAGVGDIAGQGQGSNVQGDVYSGGENAAPQGNQQVSSSEIPNGSTGEVVSPVEGAAEGGNAPGQSGVPVNEEVGPFGRIYRQFKGKAKEAIQFLLGKKEGEAVGALSHPEIGDIDLVWGEEGTSNSDGYGIAKLAKYHPEVLDNLQEIINDMRVTKRSANRVQLESDTHQAAVRLTWDNKSKNWLLTAFEKKNSVSDNTTDTGETSNGGKQNDTATLQNTVSTDEGTTQSAKVQEKAQKSGEVKDVSEETTQVEDKEVAAFDKQAEIAKEREQRAGVAPRPGHLAVAIGEGNEKAVEEWKAKFDSYLQKLNADDLPAIDATIKGMQGRKKDIRKMKKDGYKDDSIYKAYDYIETVLKKRAAELKKVSATEQPKQETVNRRRIEANLKQMRAADGDAMMGVEQKSEAVLAAAERIKKFADEITPEELAEVEAMEAKYKPEEKYVNAEDLTGAFASIDRVQDDPTKMTMPRIMARGKDGKMRYYNIDMDMPVGDFQINGSDTYPPLKVLYEEDVYGSGFLAEHNIDPDVLPTPGKYRLLGYNNVGYYIDFNGGEYFIPGFGAPDHIEELINKGEYRGIYNSDAPLKVESKPKAETVPAVESASNGNVALFQQGMIELDRENPAFERATENVRKKLEATGVKVEVLTKEEAEKALAELEAMNGVEKMSVSEAKKRADAIESLSPINITSNTKTKEELNADYKSLPSVKKGGKMIEFYNSAFKKIYKEGGLFAQIVPQLDKILEQSVMAYYENDNLGGIVRPDGTVHKAHPNISKFYNYIGKVKIGGKEYYVRTTVKEEMSGQSGTHSYMVTDVSLYDKTTKSLSLPITTRARGTLSGIVDAKLKDFFDYANGITKNPEFMRVVGEQRTNENQEIFVSNARKAVEEIKQEKATPQQWLAMIKKNGGLKAGEDAWMGLEEWLTEKGNAKGENGEPNGEVKAESGKPNVITKQEVLDFVNENAIKIEEVEYEANPNSFEALKEEYEDLVRNEGFDAAQDVMLERFGDDFSIAFDDLGGELVIANEGAAATLLGSGNIINSTRLDYTTEGLENKREIALTVPTIEPYNQSDEIHFGDAGEGRAVAWVRFGETTDSEGNRVLVIDEIQSKRHQDAREKGYKNPNAEAELEKVEDAYREAIKAEKAYDAELKEKYGYDSFEGSLFQRTEQFKNSLTEEEKAKREELKAKKNELAADYYALLNGTKGVPAAPFEKNWQELAMKRMLRLAAEEGFDKVAWTTGEQQAERYNIGSVVEYIDVSPYKAPGSQTAEWTDVRINAGVSSIDLRVDVDGNIVSGGNRTTNMAGEKLADVVGKELADKILSTKEDTILDGESLRIGGEGMKGFYDKMLPSFVSKYTKKWGAKVGTVEMPSLEQNNVMHSVDVTPEMKESVMEGQPMFLRTSDGTTYGWAVNGEIYLTPEGLNPNTPIHEYTHLWAAALQKSNPKLWGEVVEAMKLSPAWNEVIVDDNYTDIHGDENRVASEVLSRLSGNEGYRRYMKQAEAEIAAERNIGEKVRKKGILNRIKNAVSRFWNWLKGKFRGESGKVKGESDKVETWEVFVNKSLKDFDEGVNPDVKESSLERMFMGKKGAENLDKAEEATTRLDNLNVAREMETAGKKAKAIKLATGWERGADGKWRYETEDTKVNRAAKLYNLETRESYPIARSIEIGRVDDNSTIRLADLVKDDELFKAYPEMEEYYVSFEEMSANVKGSHSFEEKMIRINKDDISELESTLVHEIQHAVQSIEGFAKGSSPEYFEELDRPKAVYHDMYIVRSEAERLVEKGKYKNLRSAVKKVFKEYLEKGWFENKTVEYFELNNPEEDWGIKNFIDEASYFTAEELNDFSINNPDPKDLYKRTAGEVESRNVEERLGMSPEERRNKLAEETEDVRREDQIFIFDNLGVSGMMGSRVDARMAEVASHFDGKELTAEQRSVVDVFGGKADNLTISVKTQDGNERKVVMRQGNEMGAGAKHSLYRHYNTGSGAIVADDVLLIPDVLANGERTESKRGNTKLAVYRLTDGNGTRYTVVTEVKEKGEVFNDFYTNKKALNQTPQMPNGDTQSSARTNDLNASEDKGSDNSLNEQEERTLFRKAVQDSEEARQEIESLDNEVLATIEELAQELYSNVGVIADIESIPDEKKRRDAKRGMKGWYDPATGMVSVVLPNIADKQDAVETMLHEIVGHRGLRGLLGEKYNEFLNEVFVNAPKKMRADIMKIVMAQKADGNYSTFNRLYQQWKTRNTKFCWRNYPR